MPKHVVECAQRGVMILVGHRGAGIRGDHHLEIAIRKLTGGLGRADVRYHPGLDQRIDPQRVKCLVRALSSSRTAGRLGQDQFAGKRR